MLINLSSVVNGGFFPVNLKDVELPFFPFSLIYPNFLNIAKDIFPRCLLFPQAFLSLSCKSCKMNSPFFVVWDSCWQAFHNFEMLESFCLSDPMCNIRE